MSRPATLVLAFLALAAGWAAARQPSLADARLRLRGATWPGGALFVSVEAPAGTTGTWSWGGQTGSLDPAPYGLRTGLAVPLDSPPGASALLRLDLVLGTERRTLERRVSVAPKARPVQYLSMNAETEARYQAPGVQQEYQEIGAALRRSSPERLWQGRFRRPLPGPELSGFGLRRIHNGKPAGHHRGLDLGGWRGEAIVAPAGALVVLARTGYELHGNTVVLDHGQGLASLYLHMDEIYVQEGERVAAGQPLGTVGSTGASTGPHLHWAVYFHGTPVDPHLLLNPPREW
jgi:murein DD-endopeptidase MepM/ murein hydrolase activator NlpD